MPTPAWDTVAVRYKAKHLFTGTVRAGTVTLTLTSRLTWNDPAGDSVVISEPDPQVFTLDVNGAFATAVPAIDDPNIAPDDWAILVVEAFSDGSDGKSYYIYPMLSDVALGYDIPQRRPIVAASDVIEPTLVERGLPGGFTMLNADGVPVGSAGQTFCTQQAFDDLISLLTTKGVLP